MRMLNVCRESLCFRGVIKYIYFSYFSTLSLTSNFPFHFSFLYSSSVCFSKIRNIYWCQSEAFTLHTANQGLTLRIPHVSLNPGNSHPWAQLEINPDYREIIQRQINKQDTCFGFFFFLFLVTLSGAQVLVPEISPGLHHGPSWIYCVQDKHPTAILSLKPFHKNVS